MVTTAGVAALLLVAFGYIAWYLYLVFGKRANPLFSSQYVSTAIAPLQKLAAKPQAETFAKLKASKPAQSPVKTKGLTKMTSKPARPSIMLKAAKTSKPSQTTVRKPAIKPQTATVQKPAQSHVMLAKLQAAKPAAKPSIFKRKK